MEDQKHEEVLMVDGKAYNITHNGKDIKIIASDDTRLIFVDFSSFNRDFLVESKREWFSERVCRAINEYAHNEKLNVPFHELQ